MKHLNRPRGPLREDSPLVRRRPAVGNGVVNGIPEFDIEQQPSSPSEESKYYAKRRKRSRMLASPVAMLLVVNFGLVCFFLIRARLNSKQCPFRKGEKPTVEFYLHGRGSGHWTGSWGLMEVLLDRGYDLVVYATSAMPLVTNVDYSSVILDILNERIPRQEVIAAPPFINYTLVDDLLPGQSFWTILSILWKRVPRRNSARPPLLMVSDGDFAASIQSYLYGIPSLYTTHGQMFTAHPLPDDLPDRLAQSWKAEARTNGANAMWTTHELGFNHVPLYETIRPRLRNIVREMAHQRAARLQAFQGAAATMSHRKLVVTYFRDANGQKAVEYFLEKGLDVVVHGFVPQVESPKGGRLIPVDDIALFVQFMSVADGIVASGGCILQAECVYASIPLLAFYEANDTEHELNVYMSKQWKPTAGARLIHGMSFEDLNSHESIPSEVETFLETVKSSEASASFYAIGGKHDDYSSVVFSNADLEGTKEHADVVLGILEEEKRKLGC